MYLGKYRKSMLVMVFVLLPVLLGAEGNGQGKYSVERLQEMNRITRVTLFSPAYQSLNKQSWQALMEKKFNLQKQQKRNYKDTAPENRKGLYWGTALAVVGGTLAWWSKNKADAAYDKYLHVVSRKRQATAIDRAKRFDRLSGGALALMEIGVVCSVYFTFLNRR